MATTYNSYDPYSSNNTVTTFPQSSSAPLWSEIYNYESQSVGETTNGAPPPNAKEEPPIQHSPPSNVLVDQRTTLPTLPPQDDYYYSNTLATVPSTQLSTIPPQRTFRGRPVKTKNAHLHDDILAFKEKRKTGTVVSTWVGGAVGLVALAPVLGPVGVAVGATAGYGISKSVGKAKERKLIRTYQEAGLTGTFQEAGAIENQSPQQYIQHREAPVLSQGQFA